MVNHRVAWFLTVTPFYWHPLLRELSQRFSEFRVYTAGWPGYAPGYDNSFQVQVIGDRKFIGLTRNKQHYGSGVMYLSPQILNYLIAFKPTVIFADGFCLWTLFVLLLKGWMKWRVILLYDGSSPNVDFRTSKLRLMLRRTMIRCIDACITNTKGGQTYLVETLGTSTQRVQVQPYLVPAPEALLQEEPSTFPKPEGGQFLFLLVGQLIPRKGIQEFLEACALLIQQGYGDFRVWIIGEGWQKQDLMDLSTIKGLTDHIHWLGQVPYSQLGHYFSRANVFVFPTLEDVWGTVVPESMGFGKPILCSKWAGAAELVIDGETGYQFDPHCPAQLANLMRDCLEFPERFVEMGQRSQQVIRQYTPEVTADALADLAMNTI